MPRQNTKLESEGAEFLVLGQLLIQGVPTYKTYTNMPGYDLVAMNPERNRVARVQVKSRRRTKAEGFIINNFNCDFVVIVRLNRGSKDGLLEVRLPEYFIFPVDIAEGLPQGGWGKIAFSKIPSLESYRENWSLIRTFLDRT